MAKPANGPVAKAPVAKPIDGSNSNLGEKKDPNGGAPKSKSIPLVGPIDVKNNGNNNNNGNNQIDIVNNNNNRININDPININNRININNAPALPPVIIDNGPVVIAPPVVEAPPVVIAQPAFNPPVVINVVDGNDGGLVDNGPLPGGAVDGGVVDSGFVPGGVVTGGVDGGAIDSGVVDGGVVDGGVVDNGPATTDGTTIIDSWGEPSDSSKTYVYTLYYTAEDGTTQVYGQYYATVAADGTIDWGGLVEAEDDLAAAGVTCWPSEGEFVQIALNN